MDIDTSDSDPANALRVFCAKLRDLRRAAGGPTVESLGADKKFPLGRAHIYATLGGKIAKPPTWRFVEAFVHKCESYAADSKVDLPAQDLAKWEQEHEALRQLWERRSREQHAADALSDRAGRARGRVLTMQDVTSYLVRTGTDRSVRRMGIVTGDIRQVRCANVWVNPENTEMEMARVHEFSISAIIRYEGARHDARGRIAEDLIADELAGKIAGDRPVEPGSVVPTGAGELRRRNAVRHVLHAAAVHGEPGSGFHPMREIGRCVTNALLAAETLDFPDDEAVTVLFPLLGTGSAGGDLRRTATLLIHAARNYLRSSSVTRIGTVLFLAYTDLDLKACRSAFQAAGLSAER